MAARGGVIVVADVPLRDVDQMVVAVAARGIRHAREAEIGAIGKNGREQCRLVGRRIAGAQMGEAVGEPGPGIDLGQNLGDPHPGQQAVEPVGQRTHGVRNGWLDASDVAGPSRSRRHRVHLGSHARRRTAGAREVWRHGPRSSGRDRPRRRGWRRSAFRLAANGLRKRASPGCLPPRCRCPAGARAMWPGRRFHRGADPLGRSRKSAGAISRAGRKLAVASESCFCRHDSWP